jgi:adenylate cyclase
MGAVLRRSPLVAYIVGGCFALFAAAVSVLPAAWRWQEAFDLTTLFSLRGARDVPADVVLVPIDEQAARRIFLPQQADQFERCQDVRLDKPLPGYRNPDPPHVLTRWPRCLHARALEAIAVGEPAAIVMDISFRPRSDPSGAYREQDRMLAAAIRKAGPVLLALNIGMDREGLEQAQPIAGEIETAALALAPFLVLGDQMERADKFCTFKEDAHGWSLPCLPTVAHLVTSLSVYPKFRRLLERTAARDIDLTQPQARDLLADGALHVPATLLRRAATSEGTPQRIRSHLDAPEARRDGDFARLRSLVDIYLGPATRYFNFYGPAGSFQMLRYEELVAGDAESRPRAGSLRGKVVFIGFAEHARPQTSEHFATPFTRESIKLSGVELAATAYANLEDGSSIVPAVGEWRFLIVLFFGLVLTLIGVLLLPRNVLYGTLAVLAAAGAYLMAAVVIFEQVALWLPVSPLGLSVIGGFATGFVELKRKRVEAEMTLRELLPGPVVDKIINQNQKLSEVHESVVGACLITDLQGFSNVFQTRTPDEVVRMLNSYFDALFPVVRSEGGHPIDVLGDAMLAVWYAANPTPAVRENACVAALQLVQAAERFREPGSDEAFHTRIGIEYGEMSIGGLGSASHREYRPVGIPVNAASRLQELCKELKTRVLVTSSVIAGLKRFLVRDLGHFKLRGFRDHVHVYELMGERDKASPAQLELCERFRLALACYQAGSGDEAKRRFEEILGGETHKHDGPSAFFAQKCAEGRHLAHGVVPQD